MYCQALTVVGIFAAFHSVGHVCGTVIPITVLAAIQVLIAYRSDDAQSIAEKSVAV